MVEREGWNPYWELPGLENVYLEDSFVGDIEESADRIAFELDLVLRESHPLYHTPKEGEQYCYRDAALVFDRPSEVTWYDRSMKVSSDAAGEPDLGNIDLLTYSGDRYRLSGDWGSIELSSEKPRIDFAYEFPWQ
jgi:hypothetical protein